MECLAEKYGVSKRDLIRVNSLNRRSLRAGQELIIPHAGDIHEERIHPHEILVMNATNEHDQVGFLGKCSPIHMQLCMVLLTI